MGRNFSTAQWFGCWLVISVVAALVALSSGTHKATAQQPGTVAAPSTTADRIRQQRIPAGDNELPLDRYLKAREHIRQMPQYTLSADAAATWTELGPGNLGGRTRALVIHPTNPNTMYAVAHSGGIWKTMDGGVAWRPLSDLFATLTVSALALDPANPEVLYAGTGDQYTTQFAARGVGIFKSADGGATWTLLPATATLDFRFVNDLVVSARSSQRVYAATGTGVWRSLDGGATWTLLLDGRAQGGAQDLALRTDQAGDFMFAEIGFGASVGQSTPDSYSLYRNVDAGGAGTWSRLDVTSYAQTGLARLAIAPANQNIVYALFAPNESGRSVVLARTTNGGATWTSLNLRGGLGWPVALFEDLPNFYQQLCNLGPGLTGGAPASGRVAQVALAVDPADPQRLWLGGTELFRSDDGGADWGVASASWLGEGAPQYAGSRHAVLAFAPGYNGTTNRTLFVANDNGIFRTDDARAPVAVGPGAPCLPATSKVVWRAAHGGYGAVPFVSGAVAAEGHVWVGGTLGNGVALGNAAADPNNWRKALSGDTGAVVIDPTNANVIYAVATGELNTTGSIYPSLGGALKKSTDGGRTFGTAGISFGLGFPLTIPPPLVLDSNNPRRLYSGPGALYRSDNGGAGWNYVPPPAFNNNGSFTALGLAPTNANRVLAGTESGLVINFDSALQQQLNAPAPFSTEPRRAYLSSLTFDPINAQIAYATYTTFGGAHVWKSVNAGRAWTSIDGSGSTALPDVPVNALALDPSNSARLFIGTDLGIFVSPDGGATWLAESGLPRVPVAALVVNVNAGTLTLYAFTHGRGLWRAPLGAAGAGACRFDFITTEQSFDANGGAGNLSFSATANNCAWMAQSNDSWLSLNSAASGTGTGTARFTVAANRALTPRVGTLGLGGRSLVVRQAAFVDRIAPAVNILSPAPNGPNGVFTTELDSIVLSGTAGDEFGVRQVIVDGYTPGNSVVRGTANWTTLALPLSPGFNRLSVSAIDNAGNQSSAALTVFRRSEQLLLPVTDIVAGGIRQMAFDAAGALYFTDFYGVRKLRPDGTVVRVAGTNDSGFAGDGGPALEARFFSPQGLAFDRAGNLFVADSGNDCVRKITPAGIVTTVAGSAAQRGYSGDGGPGTAARLWSPQDLLFDAAGNLYIADYGNARVRKLASNGVITTFAGGGAGGDGSPANAAAIGPAQSLAFDTAGNLYIATQQDRIRRVTPQGVVSTIAGAGNGGDGGPALTAALSNPNHLTFDGAGNLYFADGNALRVIATNGIIRTVARGFVAELLAAPNGDVLASEGNRVSRLVPFPTSDKQAPTLTLLAPTTASSYTTTASAIHLRVRVTDNTLVTRFVTSNDRASGNTSLNAMSAALQPSSFTHTNAPLTRRNAQTQTVIEATLDFTLKPGLNRLTVTAYDLFDNAASLQLVVNLTPQAVLDTFAGRSFTPGFSGDGGLAVNAQFNAPRALAFDAAGNLFVADTGNQRIRKITTAGIVSTIAGNGTLGFSGDGGAAAAAELNEPCGLAVDAAGNLYFADSQNHRVRKVTSAGVISTVAGTGTPGFSGDGGPALNAQLNLPLAVAVDAAGDVFIADTQNRRVRKLSIATGRLTTIAAPNYGGAQANTEAALGISYPTALAFDRVGNLLIADRDRGRIDQLTPSGNILTIAGGGDELITEGIPAGQARLDGVGAVTADATGNVYALSFGIARITPDGHFFFAFISYRDVAADGVSLGQTSGLAVDRAGKLYLADTGNHRIAVLTQREFSLAAAVNAASYSNQGLAPDSIAAVFGTNLATSTASASTLPLPSTLAGTTVAVRDSTGAERPAQLFFVSPTQINFLVPGDSIATTLPQGLAPSVIVNNSRGETSRALVQITRLNAALFAANANGQGVAAAVALRVKADGAQNFEPVAVFDPVTQRFVPRALDLGPEGEQVYLLLFGTGLRRLEALRVVTATVGGFSAPVFYAGAQGDLAGLDQINLLLPRALAGRGLANIVVKIENQAANTLQIQLK